MSDHNRSEELFKQLANEEPPLDVDSDTAPSRTAPRPAVVAPQQNAGRIILFAFMTLSLLITIAITVLVFADSSEEPEANPTDDVPVNPIVQQNETATPIITPTALPPTPVELSLEDFSPEVLPTAAADVVGAALLTPIPESNSSFNRLSQPFTVAGSSGRDDVTAYIVEAGDTLVGLSDRFGIDVCTIVWSNPRRSVSPLRPGVTIDLLPLDGVFYRVEEEITVSQVAQLTAVTPDIIIDNPYNRYLGLTPDAVLLPGMKIVVPGGTGGDCNVWAPVTTSSGGTSSGGSAANTFGSVGGGSLWGCSYSLDATGFPANNPMGGSYTFFQSFTAVHSGVDLSAASGTPVLASGSGTVAFSGTTSTGYGEAIVIDHGGSYSLYAHLSSRNVSCGQSVSALQVIGGVGSTGRSSGNHLHFEIRDAGFNPLDPVSSIPF